MGRGKVGARKVRLGDVETGNGFGGVWLDTGGLRLDAERERGGLTMSMLAIDELRLRWVLCRNQNFYRVSANAVPDQDS